MVAPNAFNRIPRTVDRIIPDRLMTKLTYNGFTAMTIAPTLAHATKRWRPTGVYDVDPDLGSTTVVGFNELANLYTSYRVLRSRAIMRVANNSDQPVMIVLIPLNADPGSSPTLAEAQSWVNNSYAKTRLCAAIGSPVASVSCTMSTEKIYGSKMVYFDDNFASLISTIPNNNWYWAIGLLTPLAVASGKNYNVEMDISMDVEFYDRRNLLN